MTSDPALMAELDELKVAIAGYSDPRRASVEWKQVFKLLQKTDLPSPRVTHVVGMRDMDELAKLIEQLRGSDSQEPADMDVPSQTDCKRALQAFRKRLKLTMLDEESTLGRSQLTKGHSDGLDAMVPPAGWPDSVWQELVRQGKLRYIGNGFYKQAKQA